MDKDSISEIITCFRSALESRGVKIDRIILYGSWAKGTQREDSDIDLVVISEDFKDKDFWQRINMLSDPIYEVFAPIEARAFTPEEWERGDSFILMEDQNEEVNNGGKSGQFKMGGSFGCHLGYCHEWRNGFGSGVLGLPLW